MGLSPETAAAFAESMADNTALPTNPDQPEVLNLTPATPEAENETMPDAAKLCVPAQPEVRMSIRQIFERAFVQNDFPNMLTHAKRQELPPDCREFVRILNNYYMEDGEGLYIYNNHPQLAAKIMPALNAGIKAFHDSDIQKKWTWVQIQDYVFGLAQTALDGIEESNSQPASPRAENKTAPPTTVPTTTVQSEARHIAAHQAP